MLRQRIAQGATAALGVAGALIMVGAMVRGVQADSIGTHDFREAWQMFWVAVALCAAAAGIGSAALS